MKEDNENQESEVQATTDSKVESMPLMPTPSDNKEPEVTPKLPRVDYFFKRAFAITGEKIKLSLYVVGLTIASIAILGGVAALAVEFIKNKLISAPIAAIMIIAIIAVSIVCGSTLTGLFARRDDVNDIKTAFKFGFKYTGAYLWIQIISIAMMIVAFCALYVPGMYLAIAISFAPILLFVEGRKGSNAIRQSMGYVKNYWWAVFGRVFAIAVLGYAANMIVSSVFGLINENAEAVASIIFSIFVSIVTLAYKVALVEELKKIKPEETVKASTYWVYVLMVIMGILLTIALAIGMALASYTFNKNKTNSVNEMPPIEMMQNDFGQDYNMEPVTNVETNFNDEANSELAPNTPAEFK